MNFTRSISFISLVIISSSCTGTRPLLVGELCSTNITFSPDGNRLLVTLDGGKLGIWNINKGAYSKLLLYDIHPNRNIYYSSNGRNAIACRWNGDGIIINADTLNINRIISGMDGAITCAIFSKDKESIIYAKEGVGIFIDSLKGNGKIAWTMGKKDVIACMDELPNSKGIVAGYDDGRLTIERYTNDEQRREYNYRDGPVCIVKAVSSNEVVMATLLGNILRIDTDKVLLTKSTVRSDKSSPFLSGRCVTTQG